MNILITGGCGFIGSHIVEYHLNKGDTVRVVDDLSTGHLKNVESFRKNPRFKLVIADILKWPKLDKSVMWADKIYHMAAVIGVYRVLAEPINVINTNILGSERLFTAIRNAQVKPRVIIASSSSVYGHNDCSILNEKNNLIIKKDSNPLSVYAMSKIVGEELGLAYFHEAKLPITMIRFFNVVGPRQVGCYGMVIPRFIERACKNQPIVVYGDGSQTRSFCDVRDVVDGLVALIDNENSLGQIVNLGNDNEISMLNLAKLIRDRAESQSEIHYLSYGEAYGKDFIDIKQRRPDLSKFYDLTDHQHKWSLEMTIDNLISLFRSQQTIEN